MKPLRMWTIPGDPDLTITVHQPAVTLQTGDGPEIPLSPSRVSAICERFGQAEFFFESEDPEIFDHS